MPKKYLIRHQYIQFGSNRTITEDSKPFDKLPDALKEGKKWAKNISYGVITLYKRINGKLKYVKVIGK